MRDKRQPFRRDPLLGDQPNKGRGQNVKIVLSKNHSQDTRKPGQQQHQKKIGHSFKNTKAKLCHSKVVTPNKISLSYLQSFNVNRVHPLVRNLYPTNPMPELTIVGRLSLAKLTQDPNILNII